MRIPIRIAKVWEGRGSIPTADLTHNAVFGLAVGALAEGLPADLLTP
jgi:hypothetical protein